MKGVWASNFVAFSPCLLDKDSVPQIGLLSTASFIKVCTMVCFRRLLACFILLIAVAGPHAAWARPTLSPLVSTPVSRPLAMMPIADQLQSLINGTPAPTAAAPAQTVVPVAPVTPLTPAPSNLLPSTGTTAPALPATPVPTTKADTVEDVVAEPQETFGTRALNLAISDLEIFRLQSQNFIENFSAWQNFSEWLDQQTSDSRHQQFWLTVLKDIPKIVGIPLLVAGLIELLMLPFFRKLRKRPTERWVHKLWIISCLYLMKLLPVVIFIVTSLALLDKNEAHRTARFVILNVIYALAVGRFVIMTIRALLAPTSAHLRFVPIASVPAVYAYRALRAFSLVIIYGYFLVDVARSVHVPPQSISMFGNILGLVLVAMAIIVIVQKRAFVATLLRGNLSVARPNLTSLQALRLWFARSWHVLAIAYLVIGYGVTSLGVENGFALMLRGTIVSVLALFVIRFVSQALERWSVAPNTGTAGAWVHRSILGTILRPVLWIMAFLAAGAAWGVDVAAFFSHPLGQRILGGAFSLGLTLFFLTFVYELFNYTCERHLNRVDDEGNAVPVSSRTRTLLPMLRNTVFIIFFGIVTLVALSEVGINIGPLLAGAGVVGVAIGFGSQTLVKDFLTGLFIVLENTIAIGDVVKIGDHSGVVEAMSVRTLRLRDQDGALHILPFSEVTQIINMTKDFAFAVVDMAVAYSSDLEHVMSVIRSVGEDLQKDAIFKRVILEPIEILGIEKMGDSSITLRSRMRTRAGKQWDVKRLLLLRLKQRFDLENIEIPFPTVMQLQRESRAVPSNDVPGS